MMLPFELQQRLLLQQHLLVPPSDHERQRRLSNLNEMVTSIQQQEARLRQLRQLEHLRELHILQAGNQAHQPLTFQQPTNTPNNIEAPTSNLLRMMMMMERENALKRQRDQAQQQEQAIFVSDSGSVNSEISDVSSRAESVADAQDVAAPHEDEPLLLAERERAVEEAPSQGAEPQASPAAVVLTDDTVFVDGERIPQIPRKSRKKDTKWLLTFEELREYKNTHGDCIVPRGYPINPRLASWVAEQRKQHKLLRDGKQSSITPERIDLLNSLGFAWNAQEAAWDRHMSDLKRFRSENGHCHVPLNHPDFPKLGLWVKEQRRHYTLMKQGKQSHMTEDRAKELDNIDFCWDTHEATWLERLRELTDFKQRHGHCVVPTNYPDNPKLGTWVHHQRRQYKKYNDDKPCHITAERIRALDSLGFVWCPRDKNQAPGDRGDSDSDTDLSSLDFRPRKRQRSV